jgi:hypothetical protein
MIRGVSAPHVRLGTLLDQSLAPAFYAIVERGVVRRPALAAALNLEVEIKVEGPYPPVRVVIAPGEVLVEDGPAQAPEVRIQGGLTDLVALLVAPVGIGGIPSLRRAEGRRAISRIALGHVRIEGRLSLIRRLLAVIRI